MTNPQTEARAIAQTSLWVPAKLEHAKIGWTYDFEQLERISRAAYDSTGYDATMEVVEFVMAEADRRHATALAAKNAELAEANARAERQWAGWVKEEALRKAVEAQLAEANKALFWYENNVAGCRLVHSGGDAHRNALQRDGGERARRAREAQGGE